MTLPEQTITYIEKPVPLVEAYRSVDEDGYASATIQIDEDEYIDFASDPEYFMDNMVDRAFADTFPYMASTRILAKGPGGELYVEVRNNLVELFESEPSRFDIIPDDVIAEVRARLGYRNGV